MELFLDCYALLQVSPNASSEEITKAYRALARQLHPDINANPDATERFIELQKAYDVLSDPEKRKTYDAIYQQRRKKQEHQDRKNPTVAQKQSSQSQSTSLYIIMRFEPEHVAHVIFNHTTYSLTADEVTRLTRDGMLRVQSGNRGDDLLMYCIHCHAFFTRRTGKNTITIRDMPYEHFPLCPHCQSVDWCPANDALEQRERVEKLERAKQWLQEGGKYKANKNYQEALSAYEQAIQLDPNSFHAWFNKGYALNALYRYEEAIAAYEQTLRLDPNYVNAWYNKGYALIARHRYEEAVAAYEQTLRLDPNYVNAWYNKGVALNGLKRYEEALAACEQALRLDPEGSYNYSKGVALNGLKRYEEALAAYDQAIHLDPDSGLAWKDKGDLLMKLGRYEEAIVAYEQTFRLYPRFTTPLQNKGDLLMKLGRYEEALATYEQTLQLFPDDGLAYEGKEEALQKLHHHRKVSLAQPQAVQASAQPSQARKLINSLLILLLLGLLLVSIVPLILLAQSSPLWFCILLIADLFILLGFLIGPLRFRRNK